MSDKKITIGGKVIDYGDMTDEQLLNLQKQLLKRQLSINKKIEEMLNKNQDNK